MLNPKPYKGPIFIENLGPKDNLFRRPIFWHIATNEVQQFGKYTLRYCLLQQKERLRIYLKGLGVESVITKVAYHRFCYHEFIINYVLEHLKHNSVEKESPYAVAFKEFFTQVEQVWL